MSITWLIPVLVSIVAAVLLFLFGRSSSYGINIELTKKELASGVVATLLLCTLVSWAGKNMAVDNAVGGYKEFWNGSMTQALSERISCERDGDCERTYKCDPYQELEYYYETEYYTTTETGSDGKLHTVTKSRQVQKSRWVTKYHQCPYATEEYKYWLVDSFDRKHTIWSHTFASDPREWRAGSGIPNDVDRGEPPKWARTKQLIAEGRAPGVTKEEVYVNYVLASTNSILKPYSDDVERYKKAGLLQPHTENWKSPMLNDYTANKVVFVGKAPGDASKWQDALARFNAALGSELQGDMHILVVKSSKIDNPDAYLNAVRAYWQGSEFGKRALGKNGIIVVVGLNNSGKTVEWVRADTGMPTGNSEMTTALELIKETSSDPYSLIGDVKSKFSNGKVKYIHSDGVIESVVFKKFPFKRACMECNDKGDTGQSYTYLKKDIKLTGWAKFWIVFISVLMNIMVWGALWYFDPFKETHQETTHQGRRPDNW